MFKNKSLKRWIISKRVDDFERIQGAKDSSEMFKELANRWRTNT
jgi:hypothetical protein